MDRKIIALVGGTGHLGTLIANALLEKPDVQLRLLVRAGSRVKLAELDKRGAQVVEGALGAEDGAALAVLCKGAYAVVSSVQGGPDVIIAGQNRLLHAARDAGVRRFIPSDYSIGRVRIGAQRKRHVQDQPGPGEIVVVGVVDSNIAAAAIGGAPSP